MQPVDLAVELDLDEHRLDGGFPVLVERSSEPTIASASNPGFTMVIASTTP